MFPGPRNNVLVTTFCTAEGVGGAARPAKKTSQESRKKGRLGGYSKINTSKNALLPFRGRESIRKAEDHILQPGGGRAREIYGRENRPAQETLA